MKRTITVIAVSVSALLTTPALAGHEEMAGSQLSLDAKLSGMAVLNASQCESKGAALLPAEQSAFMRSCLAEASSPANVRAVALQQKKAYCDKNVKNKGLQGGDKENYLNACMNHNEAQVQFDKVNRGMSGTNTNIASIDFDKALQKFAGFFTTLVKTSPAGSE